MIFGIMVERGSQIGLRHAPGRPRDSKNLCLCTLLIDSWRACNRACRQFLVVGPQSQVWSPTYGGLMLVAEALVGFCLTLFSFLA